MSTSCRGVRGSGKNKRPRQDAWQVAGRVTDWRRHSWGGGSGWEDRKGRRVAGADWASGQLADRTFFVFVLYERVRGLGGSPETCKEVRG
jgi:hypothetical protein